jgi:hypothetical protein
MPQLPLCVQYLTAFSTPIIALIVAMIALAQWRTAHQRMVIDLFERRMNLIDELSRIVSAILFEGALRREDADGFLRATRGDKFLFGSEVAKPGVPRARGDEPFWAAVHKPLLPSSAASPRIPRQ